MSSDTQEAMLIAGERGGKSTFLGAMAAKLRRGRRATNRGSSSWMEAISDTLTGDGDVLAGDYEVLHGDEDLFDSVMDRMRSGFKYPEQTRRPDTYIIEFKINEGQEMAATTNVAVMDIPGEAQRDAIEQLKDEAFDPEEVHRVYTQDGIDPSRGAISDRVADGKPINTEEWKWAYLYRYIRCDRVIFLYNLHKALRRDDLDTRLDTGLLETVSRKKNCLLLITAVDELGYDPDTFDVGMLSGGVTTRNFDDDLESTIDSQIPGAHGDEIMALIATARSNDIDMFGIAVPAGQQQNAIRHDNGRIVLQGFDNVGEWLKRG
ncbi:MAG: hypothetical protein ABEI80_08820 [Haloplanus sp.]